MLPFSKSKPATGKKLEKKKVKALCKIKMMAKLIVDCRQHFDGYRFYQKLIGKVQRYFFRREELNFPKNFKFSKEKCVNCKQCIKSCPTGNLIMNDSDDLDWMINNNCILCFRCYNFCSKNAITLGKKVPKIDTCIRYKGPVKGLNISDIRK